MRSGVGGTHFDDWTRITFQHGSSIVGNTAADSIISLIAEIEDAFDVTVPAVEVVPANFNSVKAMWSMIERLQEEE